MTKLFSSVKTVAATLLVVLLGSGACLLWYGIKSLLFVGVVGICTLGLLAIVAACTKHEPKS